jgi:hypothetical protein
MVFSLTNSIQDISMFLTCRVCQDWEFRAMKTQALVRLRRLFRKLGSDLALAAQVEIRLYFRLYNIGSLMQRIYRSVSKYF